LRAIRSDDPQATLEARSDALYGAWLCGTALDSADMGLHHKLCHTLGGTFNLPHAQTHAIVLPHALAYNAKAAPAAMQRIATALGGHDAAQSVYDLAQGAGAGMALKAFGLRSADLDRACDIALQNRYPNPRPLEAQAIRQLLQDAFDGVRPTP
jgi:alcohol dehydrogenase class IV